MSSTCANCINTFGWRPDGKSFLRHSMSAKLFRSINSVTVGNAVEFCFPAITITPEKNKTVFICNDCLVVLKQLYDLKKSQPGFTERTSEYSYIHKKRKISEVATQNTPRKLKKRMISTPVKKIPVNKERTSTTSSRGPINNIDRAVRLLSSRHHLRGMRLLLNSSIAMKRAIRRTVGEEIKKEISKIIKDKDSLFIEPISLEVLEKFTWVEVTNHIQNRAPLLFTLLCSTQLKGRKFVDTSQGVPDDIRQTVGCLLGILMFKRDKRFKLLQTINSIQLWICGCKSTVIIQSHRMGWCLNPCATRSSIDKIKVGFDRDIKVAKSSIEDNLNKRTHGVDVQSMHPVDLQEDDAWETDEEMDMGDPPARKKLFGARRCMETDASLLGRPIDLPTNDDLHPGYTFCWDNIGRHTVARHQTREQQNQMHLWALAYIAMNRVPTTHLSLTDAIPAVDIPLKSFLPTTEDIFEIKNSLKHTVSAILCEYIPFFSENISDVYDPVIQHKHTNQMNEKSKLVNLGIVHENPSTVAGTIAILENLHKYVPRKEDLFNPCIVFGDGLSCERHNDAHNARCTSVSKEERLEGLEPSPQEFHKRMLLLQDTMNMFFDASSSCDKGTLYNVKNIYGHRSVQKDVSKCFNFAADLLEHSTDSLVIALAMTILNMKKIGDTPENASFQNNDDKEEFLNDISEKVVNWQDIDLNGLIEAVNRVEENSSTTSTYKYCVCHEEIDEEITMIGCDKKNCQNQWFHLECVGLTPEEAMTLEAENSKWYCRECTKLDSIYKYCKCKTDKGEYEPMIRCSHRKCENGQWFHYNCVGIKESAVPKGKWYCSPLCKRHRSTKTSEPSGENEDHQNNYLLGLIWEGLNDRIRKKAIRSGNGPVMITYWKIDLLKFFAKNLFKYRC